MRKWRNLSPTVRMKPLSRTEFDLESPGYDWHLRCQGGQWILEQFDSSTRNANDAHLRTIECESKHDGIQHVREEPPKGGKRHV